MDLLGELERGFAGSYRIERELGGGGMSRVFLATEAALGRRVVIKVLSPELMLGVSAERFKREIAVVAQLQHPHIVPVITAGEAADRDSPWRIPYYTMPFVEGESLRARIAHGPVPVANTVSILRDVIKALAYAHDRGIVHRDIKPDNVLLTANSAVVTDFGVAKAIVAARSNPRDTDLTHTGSAVGTPSYMAPEQASGSANVDHRADIYSFGVMAFEMLAGHRPPDAELPLDTPAWLADLIAVCMDREPARRPQTAAEVVSIFENVSSGATLSVRALTVGRHRRRALWMVAGLATVALAVALVARRLGQPHPAEQERILVGDFHSTGRDSTLGPVVTEAFRTALAQSRGVFVTPTTVLRDALRSIGRDGNTPVDGAVAREIATREGAKAYVDGEVLSAGDRYVISVRLVQSSTGGHLAVLQENVASENDILPGVDRVVGRLRERMGESLAAIKDTPPVEQVTTASLDALRAYVMGSRAIMFDGDLARGSMLLEQAIALDTTFAMAYRKLAAEYHNRRIFPERVIDYLTRAYRHRDRLTDAERLFTTASYYTGGPHADVAKVLAAYEALFELQPAYAGPLGNACNNYLYTHQYQRAEDLILQVERLPDVTPLSWMTLAWLGVFLQDSAQMARALAQLSSQFPRNVFATIARVQVLDARGEVDSALAIARRTSELSADPASRSEMLRVFAGIVSARGRVKDTRWALTRSAQLHAEVDPGYSQLPALDSAWIDIVLRGDTARGRRQLDRSLAAHPVASTPHVRRRYALLVRLLTAVGEVSAAREVLARFEHDHAEQQLQWDERARHSMNGDIAVAERRYDDAVAEYHAADAAPGPCHVCSLPAAAHAYDLAGKRDSAIALFTRYVDTPDPWRAADFWDAADLTDGEWLPRAYVRLGQLWAERGDRAMAARYHNRFVELWKDADPELRTRASGWSAAGW